MAATAANVQQDNEEFLAHKRQFTEFLELETEDVNNAEAIAEMRNRAETRLRVNISDLRRYDAALANRLLVDPMALMPPFEEALRDILADEEKARQAYHIGLTGPFGAHHVSPRELTARLLGAMVTLEGIVTKQSVVRPKVVKSVHYCPATKRTSQMEYRDVTDSTGLPTSSVYPTRDEAGNPLVTEYGLCEYKDYQTIIVQEMPERAPAGQLPRSTEIILEKDLVDAVKPGDRIEVVGTYRALPGRGTANHTNGLFRSVVLANHVGQLDKEISTPTLTDTDIRDIKALAKRYDAGGFDLFDLMARSLAPSIYGHKQIKRSLLLLLLGGVEKNLDNGTHLRGDMNLLMVGDPSTAKSQLLRFVLNIAPLAVSTSGRGSSGVGLTAAVTRDSDTGERRLEAGAMVLADRGIVCIDEFDKMNEADRVAIHEVMEQQTVTIAKAGIHASLNARCSVVAAANPVYGQYNVAKSPTENIGLPDSLLSRFDMLFIVLDKMDSRLDAHISEHVLRMHQYQIPGQEGRPVRMQGIGDFIRDQAEATDVDGQTEVFTERIGGRDGDRLLTVAFCRKFVQYAKARFKPRLGEEAANLIADEYAKLRHERAQEEVDSRKRNLPITPRTLETLIRCATAHAKLRLSHRVERGDAKVAVQLIRYIIAEQEGTLNPSAATTIGDMDDDEEDAHGGGAGGGMFDGPMDDHASSSSSSGGEDGGSPKRRRTLSPRKQQQQQRAAVASPARRSRKRDVEVVVEEGDTSGEEDDHAGASASSRSSPRKSSPRKKARHRLPAPPAVSTSEEEEEEGDEGSESSASLSSDIGLSSSTIEPSSDVPPAPALQRGRRGASEKGKGKGKGKGKRSKKAAASSVGKKDIAIMKKTLMGYMRRNHKESCDVAAARALLTESFSPEVAESGLQEMQRRGLIMMEKGVLYVTV